MPVVEGEPIAEAASEGRLVLKRELPNPEYAGFWVRLSVWGDFLEYRLFALAPARDAQQASEVWDEELVPFNWLPRYTCGKQKRGAHGSAGRPHRTNGAQSCDIIA